MLLNYCPKLAYNFCGNNSGEVSKRFQTENKNNGEN